MYTTAQKSRTFSRSLKFLILSIGTEDLRICSLAHKQENKEVAEQEIVPRQVQKYVVLKKAV